MHLHINKKVTEVGLLSDVYYSCAQPKGQL